MHGCCLLLVDEVADGVDSIAVDLQPPSETISVVMSGNVRHSSRTADGRFRVGIEFVAIGSLEERFLAKVIAGLSQ